MPLAGLAHFIETFARRMGFAGGFGNRRADRYWLTDKARAVLS